MGVVSRFGNLAEPFLIEIRRKAGVHPAGGINIRTE